MTKPDDKGINMLGPPPFESELHEALVALHVTLELNVPRIITVTEELPIIEATFTLSNVFWFEVTKLVMGNLRSATLVSS